MNEKNKRNKPQLRFAFQTFRSVSTLVALVPLRALAYCHQRRPCSCCCVCGWGTLAVGAEMSVLLLEFSSNALASRKTPVPFDSGQGFPYFPPVFPKGNSF